MRKINCLTEEELSFVKVQDSLYEYFSWDFVKSVFQDVEFFWARKVVSGEFLKKR